MYIKDLVQTNLSPLSHWTPSYIKVPNTRGRFCPSPLPPNVISQVTPPAYMYVPTFKVRDLF